MAWTPPPIKPSNTVTGRTGPVSAAFDQSRNRIDPPVLVPCHLFMSENLFIQND